MNHPLKRGVIELQVKSLLKLEAEKKTYSLLSQGRRKKDESSVIGPGLSPKPLENKPSMAGFGGKVMDGRVGAESFDLVLFSAIFFTSSFPSFSVYILRERNCLFVFVCFSVSLLL